MKPSARLGFLSFTDIGSWKTTRSIGRKCTAGNCLSGPVLTAKRLTALILPTGLSPARLFGILARVATSCCYQLIYTELSGDHTWMVTPVPIPNTAVKHPGPMVVSSLARVGYRRVLSEAISSGCPAVRYMRSLTIRLHLISQCEGVSRSVARHMPCLFSTFGSGTIKSLSRAA